MNRLLLACWCAALSLIHLTPPVHAGELKVPVSKLDRTDVVLRLPLTIKGDKIWENVKVTSADGEEYKAQIAPAGLALSHNAKTEAGSILAEVVVLIPEISPNEELVLKAEEAKASDGPAFSWKDEPGKHTDLMYGDDKAVRYVYEALDPEDRERTYKPFHHVFHPDKDVFLTKGPGGKFTHHRGIYYGFSKTGYTTKDGKSATADTWHCKPGAYQSHQEIVSEATGPLMGRHQVKINWHGKEGEVIATEFREIAVVLTNKGLNIDFASVLTTEMEKLKLDGDPQHAGFQFRASNEVNDKTSKQTIYIRKDGVGEPGATINSGPSIKEQSWKGMSFVVADDRFTCCYLDRPDNPKPGVYSERNYGRFGSYFVKEVTPDSPLLVRYRLFLTEGQLDPEDIAHRAENFAISP